ncbi:beta-1,4-glucuronyltransferase 1 [Hyalella azteca]|uniref:Beta-1,4-glucuronyltransferase 1 n=1 Tax=Hyalella azteca TaxID=294128 RepID=A0A8B7NKJ2_HYAAZ|nr:beta-1,4-glucuronyltransferase 1 [Hyalella azteca]
MVMVGTRRSALVRGSVFLNIVFALYVLLHLSPPRGNSVSPPHGPHDNLTQQGEAGEYSPDSDLDGPLQWASVQERAHPDLHLCSTPQLLPRASFHGNHWVLFNHLTAIEQPACNASVTYTTHADYTYLHNLSPLVERWRGPISVAVFAPGEDFNATLNTIAFLRACRPLVAQFTTFHIFFPVDHLPSSIPKIEDVLVPSCSLPPPSTNGPTYKSSHNLTYPVNVARNVARIAAATYFVLASDVELYPSLNFISRFLALMSTRDASRETKPHRRVYVLPIFEVKSGIRPPATKTSLVRLLRRGAAIPFHKFVCPQCHLVPGLRAWAESGLGETLTVTTVAKRHAPYTRWEPIYVGTNLEPLYEERLSWEGRSDKMTQMYIMCVLDYEFHVLDNAFLVHRPGIKRLRKDRRRDEQTAAQNALLSNTITPELQLIYGTRPHCVL